MTDIRNRSSRDQLYRLQQNKALLPMTELQRATVSPKRTTYFWYEAAARVGRFTHFLTQFLWGNFSGANFQRWGATYVKFVRFQRGFRISHKLRPNFALFTAMHGMQTRYSYENSVRLSVRPSVCHTREL